MTDLNTDIALRLEKIRGEIHDAVAKAGRTPDSTELVAVSKQKPVAAIRSAAAAGQVDFAENYLQEALEKIQQLSDLALCWHFIGPIQSNKTRLIAENFDWVHTVDRVRIAQRLNDQRPSQRPPVNICIQVNLQHEQTKSGIEPDQVTPLVEQVMAMPRLRLRGLMAIPRPAEDFAEQVAVFRRLTTLRDTVNRFVLETQPDMPAMDVLSMGMTNDMQAAIQAGSTHVRIGTAIFGERSNK